jgi:NADH:ubiquinone oxidoreductase subunit 3 (subunit A)
LTVIGGTATFPSIEAAPNSGAVGFARGAEDGAVDELFGNYLTVLVGTIAGLILVITALIGSRLLAPFSAERNKDTTYECGMLPVRRASTNVGMRFYLYAILFIIFDVEAVFIFPWALSFVEVGAQAYWEMVLFVAILAVGLVYAWKKGALQWR